MKAKLRAIATLLLANGADPNLYKTTSPLHMAAERPATDVLEALLKAGADPNVLEGGITAIGTLLRTLRSAIGRDEDDDDGSADIAKSFVPASLKLLLAHGCDSRIAANKGGNSPLMLAIATKGCPDEVVQMLCEAGPDTSEKFRVNDNEDIDILCYAVLSKHPPRQVLALVRAGFPLHTPYEILSGRQTLSEIAQKNGKLCELLWAEAGPEFRKALIEFRNTKGVNSLVLCAAAGSEMLVRALHAEGVSASETFESGKSIAFLVEKHAPAMLPLITELAAKEAK